MIDMYTVLITGGRKITPKMANAIMNGISRCNNNPKFNPTTDRDWETYQS